jgi:hypothetical protein
MTKSLTSHQGPPGMSNAFSLPANITITLRRS